MSYHRTLAFYKKIHENYNNGFVERNKIQIIKPVRKCYNYKSRHQYDRKFSICPLPSHASSHHLKRKPIIIKITTNKIDIRRYCKSIYS